VYVAPIKTIWILLTICQALFTLKALDTVPEVKTVTFACTTSTSPTSTSCTRLSEKQRGSRRTCRVWTRVMRNVWDGNACNGVLVHMVCSTKSCASIVWHMKTSSSNVARMRMQTLGPFYSTSKWDIGKSHYHRSKPTSLAYLFDQDVVVLCDAVP
jgi:hypothetical protein